MASSSSQHPATMDNLPGDVLSNIFIRLLSKQLAQMRCVCKPWNTLLSQSNFIKSHLHRSIKNNDNVLLFFHKRFTFHCKAFTAQPSQSPHLELPNFIKLPVNIQSTSTCVDVVGSVNGLICFHYEKIHDPVFYIWNPSLSAVLTLPPIAFASHYFKPVNFFPRFGYDPKTDDYKIVKVSGDVITPNLIFQSSQKVCPKTVDYKVEIYSMRKGSWKVITQRSPSRISMFMRVIEFCVDGIDGYVHWPGKGDTDIGSSIETIVAFDLGAETFNEIPLPNCLVKNNVHRSNVLGVLGGKLCVMSSVVDGGGYGECEVWVMEQYGVVNSWVKNHVFSRFSKIVPFGFTFRSEFLYKVVEVDDDDDDDDDDDFEVIDDDCFGLYDPTADKVKTFKVLPNITKIMEYVDSLVWVAPGRV